MTSEILYYCSNFKYINVIDCTKNGWITTSLRKAVTEINSVGTQC